MAAIGAALLFVALFPDWVRSPWHAPTDETRSSNRTKVNRRRVVSRTPPAVVATPSPRLPSKTAPSSDAKKEVPKLPPLSQTTVTPALLYRAKEVAREHPGEAWLQGYVVNAHFWLAMRNIDERRYEDALSVLDESEDWGAPEGEVAMYRAIAYRDQQAWGPAEEWARMAIAHGSTTDPAEMHHIIGKAMYFREELAWAIEEFEKAVAIRNSPPIRASLELALRDARTSDGFSQRRLSHFIVRYEGETMEDTGRMAIDTLERSYASLVSQLGFEPLEPVVVILYTRQSFEEFSGRRRHMTVGLFDGKIRLPVRGVRWGDEQIRRTLHHELSHAFFRSRAGGSNPRWLNEGLAEYVEGRRTRAVGDRLVPYLRDGGTLQPCLLKRIYNCRVFYPAAASVVDYMIQMRGMGGIRDVVSNLADGKDANETLRRVYDRDEASLIADWEHFIRRRH